MRYVNGLGEPTDDPYFKPYDGPLSEIPDPTEPIASRIAKVRGQLPDREFAAFDRCEITYSRFGGGPWLSPEWRSPCVRLVCDGNDELAFRVEDMLGHESGLPVQSLFRLPGAMKVSVAERAGDVPALIFSQGG